MFKLKILLFAMSALVLLTGCADKGTLGQSDTKENLSGIGTPTSTATNAEAEVGLLPIAMVQETFDEETEKIKKRSFDNINFENAYFSFPTVTEVCTLEYKSEVTEFTWTPDEAYDYICKRVDEFFPGMYNDEQKAYEIRFADAEPVNMETAEGLYRWPNLNEYKEMKLITERPLPMINNKSCYIELYDGVLRGYDEGDLKKYCVYDDELDMFDVLEAFPIVYRTEDIESQKKYHLLSGDISIADAVKSANKALAELELSYKSLPFIPVVQSVNVLDIGNGNYAFCFKIVTECKQMDKTNYSVSTTYDATHETNMFGEAIMCEADKLTRYRMISQFAHSDIAETNSHDSVIPLEDAAETASKYLTSGIKFKALSVTAVYKPFSDKDPMQYSEGEDYIHRKIIVKPCWKFILKPTTGAVNKLYYVFVDMLTGKAYTTVQLMESEVEYD